MCKSNQGIYSITNVETGRIYVGSAVSLEDRWARHLRELANKTHPNRFLQEDFDRFGAGVFRFAVLEEVENDLELLSREAFFIDKLDATGAFGYNIALTPFSPMKGRKHTDETKLKMREGHKNRPPISEETREKLRQKAIEREAKKKADGFVVSEETRALLAKAGTGRPVSEETRQKIRSKLEGIPLTEEHKQKLSESHVGLEQSEESRKKRSETMTEKWKDPEFRAKMDGIYRELKDDSSPSDITRG